jgi:branched-chain amino acid transport system substrate-binding protein
MTVQLMARRVADEFEKAAKAAGATVMGREFTTDKATDFTAILTTIKGKKPDLVFFRWHGCGCRPHDQANEILGLKRQVHGRRWYLYR